MYQTALLPTNRGFDSFFGYLDGAESYTSHGGARGDCANGSKAGAPFGLDLWNGTVGARGWDGVYSSEMYSHVLQTIISAHDPSIPLLLYLAFQNVHEPIDAPTAYRDLYANSTNSSSRALFSADVSALDAAVHNLTIALDQKDMLNESVIVFTTGTNRWNDRLIDSWVALPIWPVACLLAY